MILKNGVSIKGLKPEILFAIMVTNEVYKSFGFELVITSIMDGKHSSGSFHYKGMAFDCRTSMLSGQQKIDIVRTLKDKMDESFDIVLESTHIHIEYDPK